MLRNADHAYAGTKLQAFHTGCLLNNWSFHPEMDILFQHRHAAGHNVSPAGASVARLEQF
jgi:hypothetical protein